MRSTGSAREAFDHIRATADKARGGDDAFTALCPAHDDKNPSLSVAYKDGRVLLHCQSQHCEPDAICAGFNLTMADLFDPPLNGHPTADPTPAKRRYSEARGITAEAKADKSHRMRQPIACDYLADAITMLLSRDPGDVPLGIVQMRFVAGSDDWHWLDTTERSVLVDWTRSRLHGTPFLPVVATNLGTVDNRGRYSPPPAQREAPDMDAPATLAELPEVEIVPAVAHDVWYRGKVALLHGPSGGGKTTLAALAAAAVTTGGPFAGRPTIEGDIVICTEDPESWRTIVHGAGGDLNRVRLSAWADLPEAVRTHRPVAVCVDTMQYVAHAGGAGELDSAREVDAILRPLEALARETGAAVAILDHEPWSDGRSGDAATGTQARPRHSGAKVATCDAVLRVTADKSGDGGLIEAIHVGPSRAKGSRRGIVITTETLNLDGERVDGAGGGAEVDEFARFRQRAEAVQGYLMAHPDASTHKVRVALDIRGKRAKVCDFIESMRDGVPSPETLPPGTRERGDVPGRSLNGNAYVPPFPPYRGTPVRERERERERGNVSEAKVEAAVPCPCERWTCPECDRVSDHLPPCQCGHVPQWEREEWERVTMTEDKLNQIHEDAVTARAAVCPMPTMTPSTPALDPALAEALGPETVRRFETEGLVPTEGDIDKLMLAALQGVKTNPPWLQERAS